MLTHLLVKLMLVTLEKLSTCLLGIIFNFVHLSVF